MISTTAVDRLMQLAQRRGGLEIADIRQALPVDTMTVEELADVVGRLEEAGIAIEIDAGLLTPHHRKMALPDVKPTPQPAQHSERATAAHPRLLSLASSIKAAEENSSRARGSARPYGQKSATVFVLAAVLMLLLIAVVVWRFA